MSVQSVSGNYSLYQKPGYSKKWTSSTRLNGSVSQTNYVSQYNNVCTDGADDGKISFWDKLKGVGKGAINAVGNMVKGIVKNPLKSAAIIGVCCIPVVGKFIGLGLAAYGLIKSGIQLVNNIQVASATTSDAQAKDAWQNIGTSGFNAALSAVAIKGCASGLKYDLNGGSATVNLARQLKASGADKAELYSQVAKSAINETGSNIAAIPKAAYNKAKSVGQKAVDFYRANKGETFTETAGNMLKSGKDFVAEKYNNAVDKISSKVADKAEKVGKNLDERAAKAEAEKNMTAEEKAAAKEATKTQAKAKRETARAEAKTKRETVAAQREAAKATVKDIKAQAKAEGATVKENLGGNFNVTAKNGEVTYYNAQGLKTKVLEANGNVVYYGTDGKTIVRELHYFDNGQVGIYDTTKGYISPAEATGYSNNVKFGFGKLTAPIKYQTAAELTPYIRIGVDEQN